MLKADSKMAWVGVDEQRQGLRAGEEDVPATHVGAQQPMGGYSMRSFSRSGAAGGSIAWTSRVTLTTILCICGGDKVQVCILHLAQRGGCQAHAGGHHGRI